MSTQNTFKGQYLKEWLFETINHEYKSGDDSKWVYVFANPATRLCKLGVATDLPERVVRLSHQGGVGLEVVVAVLLRYGPNPSAYDVERLLHIFFTQKRHMGEWFNLTIRDLLQIRSLFYELEGDDMRDYLRSLINEYKPQLSNEKVS